jgi:hypothetical protein
VEPDGCVRLKINHNFILAEANIPNVVNRTLPKPKSLTGSLTKGSTCKLIFREILFSNPAEKFKMLKA